MKKLVVNENTLNRAKTQMILSYKITYLTLQRYLLNCLKWAEGDKEFQKEIRRKIKETGEIYKRAKTLWFL